MRDDFLLGLTRLILSDNGKEISEDTHSCTIAVDRCDPTVHVAKRLLVKQEHEDVSEVFL